MSNQDITITKIAESNIAAFLPIIFDSQVRVSKSRMLLGAVTDDTAVGVLCLDFPTGTAGNPVLEYLYVADQFRKMGIATRLLEAAYEYVSSHNYMPIQFSLKKSDFGPFLDRRDIEYTNAAPFVKIKLEENTIQSDFVKKALKTRAKNVFSYNDLKNNEGHRIFLDKYIRRNHINKAIIESEYFAPDLSFFYIKNDVTAILLTSIYEQELHINLIHSDTYENADARADILFLLTAFAAAVADSFATENSTAAEAFSSGEVAAPPASGGKYKSIQFLAANPKVLALAEKIFENDEPEIIDYVCTGYIA